MESGNSLRGQGKINKPIIQRDIYNKIEKIINPEKEVFTFFYMFYQLLFENNLEEEYGFNCIDLLKFLLFHSNIVECAIRNETDKAGLMEYKVSILTIINKKKSLIDSDNNIKEGLIILKNLINEKLMEIQQIDQIKIQTEGILNK